jgi:predicted dehydrogenase
VKALGLIGCGDVAFRTYIPGMLAESDRATVTATYDPIDERADRAAQQFPEARGYSDFDQLLDHPDLEAVFNLTPAPFHASTTRAALDRGLHVFSEKPIAASVAEGRELAEQAKAAGKLLLCAPATMATDRFQSIKSLIEEGKLGNPHLATAQMANMGPAAWREYTGDPAVFYSQGVGPILDIGVYALHGITGLFGPAKRVQAFSGVAIPERDVLIPRLRGQKITVEAADVALIDLDFGGNRFAHVTSSFAVPASNAPAIEIHGSEGSISVSMSGWYDSAGPLDLFSRLGPSGEPGSWQRDLTPPAPKGPPGEHVIEAGPRHFVDCLLGEDEPIPTAEHAIHVLEIILAAGESSASGCAIDLTTTF